MLAGDKHSSSLTPFVDCGFKKSHNIGPRSRRFSVCTFMCIPSGSRHRV